MYIYVHSLQRNIPVLAQVLLAKVMKPYRCGDQPQAVSDDCTRRQKNRFAQPGEDEQKNRRTKPLKR